MKLKAYSKGGSRTNKQTLYLSDPEEAKLRELISYKNMSVSELLRELIVVEHDRMKEELEDKPRSFDIPEAAEK